MVWGWLGYKVPEGGGGLGRWEGDCGEALPKVDRRIEMEAGLDELMLAFQD